MTSKNEPPDKYKCLKITLSSIFNDKDYLEIHKVIENAVIRTNRITTKTYLLLRLWILDKFHNNQDIPIITTDTISMCMKSLLQSTAGQKPKGNNALLYQEFKNLHSFTLEDGSNLSSILNYYVTTMITSIENNIQNHFFDYIHRFIFSFFKHKYKEQLQQNNKEFRKQLYKEFTAIEKDILNNTLLCDTKYHSWITEYRNKIIPSTYEIHYYYDIKINPYKYLKYMIFICLELEKLDRKAYQFCPLQNNVIPRHIQIDTKAVVELLVNTDKHKNLIDKWITQPKTITTGKNKGKLKNKTKGDLYNFLEPNKEFIWDTFFTIQPSIKHYSFDYTIITDGFSTSLRFIKTDCIEEEQKKKNKMKKAKKEMQGLSKEEKEKIKEEKKKIQKEQLKQKQKEKKDIPKPKQNNQEFLYIDEIPKEELQGNHIFIDPGKRSLMTMIDDNGKFYSYTNKQYLTETKRLKYNALLKNERDKIGITEIEKELNNYNSKTCNIDKFKEYIDVKIKINELVIPLYQSLKFRKYKWYSYINKKRTQDNIINKIKNKYSKDHKIIIGDWSIGKQMRNFISTPNLELKRKLKEHFKVYNIDEFRTSCLCYKTEEPCNNLYLVFKKDPNKKERKIHSILTYKMENKRIGCINRDKNGCYNIRKLFNSYMESGEIPLKYRREYKQ